MERPYDLDCRLKGKRIILCELRVVPQTLSSRSNTLKFSRMLCEFKETCPYKDNCETEKLLKEMIHEW